MTVTLNGKDYNFEVNGTVGISWKAQLIKGDEIDFGNPRDHMYLLYAAYYGSNKEPLAFDEFLGVLTSEPYNQMQTYFWQRWQELEPKVKEAVEKATVSSSSEEDEKKA